MPALITVITLLAVFTAVCSSRLRPAATSCSSISAHTAAQTVTRSRSESVNGAPHGLSYLEDTEKYEKAFRSFIENTIGGGCYDKRS